ncbi:MAG: secondary thiamine-phosphate synthase enzyme YjbQ [Eubacterium sp.]
MKIIETNITGPEKLVDITDIVRDYIREVRLKDGFIHLQVPEKTSAVTISSNDSTYFSTEFLNKINHMLPKYNGMQFTGYATSNVKASLIGMSLQVMVEGGELILGLHQSIYFAEFNGPAEGRRCFMTHMGTTLAEDEEPCFPAVLKNLYAEDLEKEKLEKAEQERLVAEMRQEYAERAKRQKEEESLK